MLLWAVTSNPIIIAFLKVFFYSLAYLHTLFMQYRAKTAFDVRVNGQVRILRWGLNEVFDLQLQRILVLDAATNAIKYVYLHQENKPLYLPTFLGSEPYDFEVHIPNVLQNREKEITNFINQYRLVSKRFTIIWI